MRKKLLLVLPLLFVAFAGAWAQVTTSSIMGLVTDPKGEALPGATVVAVHTPSGTEYGVQTNSDGRFVIPNTRVGGPYTIEVSFVGFQNAKYQDVYLKLGEPFTININLKEASTELSEVVVTSDRLSELNATRTGAATNISRDQIMSLPTITRSITDFTRLTPQASGNSFAGRDGRYNNVQIDGANFNNGFGLSTDPLPGGGAPPISLDAIEEVQVNIAPYDVRQSGFSGAGINAVTRSGTNKFVGSVYGFYRDQGFNGHKVGDANLSNPTTSVKQYGFRLGGPIIKNKLFFFVNAEEIDNKGNNPGAVNNWKASTDGVAVPNQSIARTTVADLEAVRQHLISVYGYDPGSYQGYANNNGSKSTSILARIDWNINKNHRLAIRYNQSSNTLPSLVNGNSGPNPRSVANRVSQSSMAFSGTMYNTANTVKSVSLELNSIFTPKLSNQFLATYSRIRAKRSSPSSEFPFVDIGDGTGTGDWKSGFTGTAAYNNYMSFGYELFTYGNDVLNDNYIFTDNLTYVEGKHTITGGVSFETQKFGNQYLREGTSYYRYASVADFLTTGTPGEVAPIQFGLAYPYAGQNTYAPIRYGLPSIYAQDKFDVNDRFELTYGLRLEMPVFLNKITGNPTVNNLNLLNTTGTDVHYNTNAWPKTRVMWSPRVGFRWDIKNDNSFVLRGGTGIFAGRVPFVWLTNMPSNLGVIQNLVEPSYASSSAWIQNMQFHSDKDYYNPVINPQNIPAGGASAFITNPTAGVPSTVALVANNFKMPQVWRTSLGADYTIPGTPLVATADLLYTKDLQAVYQFGANINAATQHLDYNTGDHRAYYANNAALQHNTAIGANSLTVLANTTKGYSYSATVGLSVPKYKGLSGSIYYTHTVAKATTDNAGSNASSAWGGSPTVNGPNDLIMYSSQSATPNRLMGNVAYRIAYAGHLATTVSLFYDGSNQGRYSYIYGGDMTGDGLSYDLLYVPTATELANMQFKNISTTGATPTVVFTGDQQKAALEQYISGNKFLSKHRGDYAPRNGALLPWLSRFDFRVLEDIYVGEKNKNTLQLSLDIFNIGNLLNHKWGTQTTTNSTALQLFKIATTPGANGGVPVFQMANTGGANPTLVTSPTQNVTTLTNFNTWTMQIGLRYIFN